MAIFDKPVDLTVVIGLGAITLIVVVLLFIGFYYFVFRERYSALVKDLISASDLGWKEKMENFRITGNQIKPKGLRNIGNKLYDHFLQDYLTDLEISKHELESLSEITGYFGLDDKIINSIKDKYNRKVIMKLSELKLQDKILSNEDKEQMYQIADFLNFSRNKVDEINRNNSIKIYNLTKSNALADKRLSAEEEKELHALKENLGLSDNDILLSQRDKQELAYAKLLWEIENGILPEVPSPIVLQKNEKCHIAVDATRLESKVVTTGYAGGSRGVSIRIVKGLSYRVGSFRGHAIKKEVRVKYPGTLCIINKRIVFSARQKGFTLPFNKLTSIEGFSDGLGFLKDSTYYLLQFNQVELVSMILSTSLKKYLGE